MKTKYDKVVRKELNADEIRAAMLSWPCKYQTPGGTKFTGTPVSEVPKRLRECGWRNVSHIDEYELKKMGVTVVDARYVGGARPKRFCRVAVAKVGECDGEHELLQI